MTAEHFGRRWMTFRTAATEHQALAALAENTKPERPF